MNEITMQEMVAIPTPDERTSVVQGLRDLATFLEEHPDVPVPYAPSHNTFVNDRETLARAARATSWEKRYEGEYFWLRREFRGGVTLEINIHRAQVCQRVVTGQRIEPAKPERMVDVVEWVCDDPILESFTRRGP